jgi:hypothetical protein
MANEIQFSGSLRYASGLKHGALEGSGRADQSGKEYMQDTQEIGSSEEQLLKGDVGTIGWVAVRNLDATFYVELGAGTGAYSLKVPPGGYAMAPWDGTTVYAKANSGSDTAQIEYLLIEA